MSNPFYLVAGLGKTGLSIARYLHRKNKAFAVFDTRKEPAGLQEFQAEFPQCPIYVEHFPEELLHHVIDIITSPGLPIDLPLFKNARKQGIAIYGDIECLAREIHVPVVAITGTNGKSTVTTLVGEMAQAAGIKVAVAGNIGTPVLDRLNENQHDDLWVLELSSFQLDLTSTLSSIAATILNISPDHLDRHHSMDGYIEAKQRIYHQAQTILYNRDDTATFPKTADRQAAERIISFGNDNPPSMNDWGLVPKDGKIYLAQGEHCLLAVDSLRIKGVHNWHNALAACALADAVGIPVAAMIQVLSSFAGLNHRCQWVRTLDGVDWINDSKGTNIGATISAINGIGGSMQGKIVLIAGGQGKGADFKELRHSIAGFVRSIVLIGEDADKMEAALAEVVPISRAVSLDNAVTIAKTQAKPGDVVLLSPACASLDMFRDYNHRGEVFTASVRGL
ncbi:UDP-N-acetylmuramoyl-L-alanine--D-glutamate ligase [Legionella sp. km772]|uniref:UDP-N-acetylmuramoyl-L-alanine--D-glutamate ligase n=1 Tax=Legionella sp. km772 TaxID=2498111 RepID=UPI000F8EB0DD|nr:UDP-N-acetylmuramoyl-L-alanine--D-glutamate ligase [Legionella sp. km772]RUR13606.1 UDP-N-acetylmuramoyl-L-alanine--D-glutamate ligase [Legionella sp. km772]